MKRLPVILVYIFILMIIVFIYFFFRLKKVEYRQDETVLINDGRSLKNVNIRPLNSFGIMIPFLKPVIEKKIFSGMELAEIIDSGNENFFYIKSKKISGLTEIVLIIPSIDDTQKISIPVFETYLDSDSDGFPDQCELTSEEDRKNFNRWFINIALSQYYKKDDLWMERDCAGLIRYCFKEALRKHDNKYLEKKKFLYDINTPDVEKFTYPNIPLLKERIFRTNTKVFSIADTIRNDSIFVSFAEAKYLKDNNMIFITKNYYEASPGDIMFFSNDINIKWPYHTMIFLGSEKVGNMNDSEVWILYHTGPSDNNPGMIKKMKITQLFIHPNKRWHPALSNPYFLGFYRWRMIS